MKNVLPYLIAGGLVLLVLLWFGVRLLWAGRQLDDLNIERAGLVPTAPDGSVAGKVDRRLQRTRAAVETLVMPSVEVEELRPSAGAFRQRAQTYVVLGTGLLGLAATLLLGCLLLL